MEFTSYEYCLIPREGKKFSLLLYIQTSPGAQPAPHSMGTG